MAWYVISEVQYSLSYSRGLKKEKSNGSCSAAIFSGSGSVELEVLKTDGFVLV